MTVEWNFRPSNGTDGEYQRAQLCDRCTVDHDTGWHPGGNEGGESCPIILSALAGAHSYPNPGPPEWGHDYEAGVYVCTKFQGPCACAAQ